MPKTAIANKKELKSYINENGFFFNMEVDVEVNTPEAYAKIIPEGATYFEGVVSNGELNRNGYIIRPQALIDSLQNYMLNPIILLQHDTDQPIGKCLSAGLRGEGKTQEVVVAGFIYDELTGNRFSKGLFKGLSTGHIPHEVEFQNEKTGQVISEEEFRKFNWEEQYSGDWVMAVTKLDWVEFSLVGIGSVKRALVTSKNAIGAFIKSNGKLSENAIRDYIKNKVDDEEKKEGEVKEEETKQESNIESNEGTEKAGETPESTETTVEKDGEVVEEPKEEEVKENAKEDEKTEDQPASANGEKTEVEKSDNSVQVNKLTPEVLAAIQAVVDQNKYLLSENARLQAEVNKTPNQKGLKLVSQFNNQANEVKKLSAVDAVTLMLQEARAI